jgi:integrase
VPKRALPYLQRGNVSGKKDARRSLCHPNKHHSTCKNPNASANPSIVRFDEGCAETYYFRARCRVGGKPGEKPHQFDATGRTKGEAETHLDEKIASFIANEKGQTVASSAPVARAHFPLTGKEVGVTVTDAFWKWMSRVDVPSAETRLRYKRVFKNAIESKLGSEDIGNLTAPILARFLESIPELGDDGKWHRVSYVKHSRLILMDVLRYAVTHGGKLTVNPMREVPIPDPPSNTFRHATRAIDEVSFIDIRTLITSDTRYSPYLLPLLDFMGGCGVRIGEALALRRENLLWVNDPANKVVHLNMHVVPSELPSPAPLLLLKSGLKETKIRKSDSVPLRTERFIQVSDGVIAALNECLPRVGDAPESLVFATKNDTIISPRNVRRALQSAARRANVPVGITTRSFRKMVATEIDRVMDDNGLTASGFIGNTQDVTNKHYVPTRTRVSPLGALDITDDLMRRVAPDRYESESFRG